MFSCKARSPLVLLGLVSVGISGAWAEPTAEPTAGKKIEYINEEIAVLSAELSKLKIEAEIATVQRAIAGAEAPGDKKAPPGQKPDAPSPSAAMLEAAFAGAAQIEPPAPAVPVIRSIEGADGELFATLSFEDSTTQIVRKGEVIKDGWMVSGLTSSSVTLSRNREKKHLTFGFQAPRPPAGAAIQSAAPVWPPGLR